MSANQEKREHMDYFPIPGWRSCDEQGRLPPGQKQFVHLPPGVKPVVSPEDKERLLQMGDVVTVPKADSIPKNTDPWYRVIDWKNDWLHFMNSRVADGIRKVYNGCSLFDTEPNFHVRLPKITDIWDCDVDDLMCQAAADRRAVVERKVEFMMLKTIALRLENCHRSVGHQEIVQMYRNEAYDIQCGPLEETLREMEAAFELKWGRLYSLNPHMNLSRKVYMKQKNRYVEDRFRHRMMENVGYKPNTDEITEKGRWRIEDVDDRMFTKYSTFPKIFWNGAVPTLQWEGHTCYPFDFPEERMWDMKDALLKEAQKRYKASHAEE